MIYLTVNDWIVVVMVIFLVFCLFMLLHCFISLRRNDKVCAFRNDLIIRIYADISHPSFIARKDAYNNGSTYDYMLDYWWKPLTAKSFYSEYDCIVELYND